jgi:anti-sigma regulatory factor (Ser/Thr protein kinase)
VASLPIDDLLRAAAAEVDDGSRIAVFTDTPDAVTADAAADVLHLITELAENAVQHTPPLTDVTIRAGKVGRGLAIEVEDRGTGFAEEHLESANALLEHPPELGLAAGTGLGLLVTARLAARHGITVSLRSSPIGGTTAIVVLPQALLITGQVSDTIADAGLPRIDAPMAPPALALPLPLQPATPLSPVRVPQASVPAPGPLEPAGPGSTAPAAENPAPWHWLAQSQSARTSAPESPGVEVGASRAGDLDTPTPLPRRIPPTPPLPDRGASAAPASAGSDQDPAAGAADGDSGDGPDTGVAEEVDRLSDAGEDG